MYLDNFFLPILEFDSALSQNDMLSVLFEFYTMEFFCLAATFKLWYVYNYFAFFFCSSPN